MELMSCNNKKYSNICEMEALSYTVINSQNQYEAYCERLVDLMKIKRKTRTDLDAIELLRLLIKRWDEEQRPLSDEDPVEFLRALMEQNNLKASELAAKVGISKSLLCDILHYRRRLSREVIRKLASRFNVSQDLLNKPYNLAPVAKHANSRQPSSQPESKPLGNPFQKDQALIQLLKERTGKATLARLKNGKEITIWNFVSGRRIGDTCSYLITNIKSQMPDAEADTFFTSMISELLDPGSRQTIFREEK
jgi:HTH-type transcriptional regulator / antitoxin HigA